MSVLQRLSILVFISAFPLIVCSQSPVSWDEFIGRMLEENGDDSDQNKDVYELLEEIHAHPINLNQATVEDLLQLPFLSEEQARDIVFYRMMHSPLRSTGELMFIKTLSKQDRDYLQLFCYAGESAPQQETHHTTGKILKNIRNDAIFRTDIPFYYKAGQQDYPASVLAQNPNYSYRGNPLHITFRYSLSSMNHLFAGIQTEKDAGERGIDYVSGYLMLKDFPTGRRSYIREAVLGSYRANFGLGLAINTHTKFGKSMMSNSLGHIDRGFSKHSSTMETGYLTGAAIRYQYGQITLSAFGGYNKIDGTFLKDSTGISSLKTDGLHRTPLEHSKRHNISVLNIGGNIHWDIKNWQLSATAVATHYSTPLAPKWNTPSTLYRKYNAQGKNFQVYSLAYTWRGQKLRIAGETAVSHAEGLPTDEGKQHGMATLNTLQYHINSDNRLTMALRYYGAKFTSINGRAFGENAQPQNEEGIYLAWRTTLIPGVCIDTYADLMYFPWLKY
ncbi:MAG: helix-hairpin-helix domain-containing protein, partial [Bacteroidaceae bacterium]|nr:helix-hairpin-helix domain-containing protein [Bacteroidaceae bacterium]